VKVLGALIRLTLLAQLLTCTTQATRLPAPCPAQDVVYSAADTLRGVVPPKARRTSIPRFSTLRAGSTEAIVVIEPNGHATIETMRSTGDHGPSQRLDVEAAINSWSYVPATRNGCAVRFRETITITATPK